MPVEHTVSTQGFKEIRNIRFENFATDPEFGAKPFDNFVWKGVFVQ